MAHSVDVPGLNELAQIYFGHGAYVLHGASDGLYIADFDGNIYAGSFNHCEDVLKFPIEHHAEQIKRANELIESLKEYYHE